MENHGKTSVRVAKEIQSIHIYGGSQRNIKTAVRIPCLLPTI
jgi:hypothetical protein